MVETATDPSVALSLFATLNNDASLNVTGAIRPRVRAPTEALNMLGGLPSGMTVRCQAVFEELDPKYGLDLNPILRRRRG
jgi:hypothetical protein